MADTTAIQFIEKLYEHVDALVRERLALLPDTSIAAQDDGAVISNQRRILNFQGDGVAVTEDPGRRRVNVFVPGSPATGTSTTIVSTAGLEKVYTLTGGDLSLAPANWYTVGFVDTAWSASVAMTTSNSASYTIVPGTAWVSDRAGAGP